MRRGWSAALAVGLFLAGAAPAAAFDARHPADVAAALTAQGVAGSMTTRDGESLFTGRAGAIAYKVRFEDCDSTGKLCQTLQFLAEWASTAITADQVNHYNSWTTYCPGFVDGDGHPEMWSFLPVSAATPAADVAALARKYAGCVIDFDKFVANPTDYFSHVNGGSPG
jgi:hypothetical protein